METIRQVGDLGCKPPLIKGKMLIGQKAFSGKGTPFFAIDPSTNTRLEPIFGSSTIEDLRHAAELAHLSFDPYRQTPKDLRAHFLEVCAEQILALGNDLIDRAVAETGLTKARLEGERGRTIGQLRHFANELRHGHILATTVDPCLPNRSPSPRPTIIQRKVPVGPVAIFGAANFPLAFSVAGGDTVSALAAGCPVIVKVHPGHPGTSEIVGQAIQRAVTLCALPNGVFSLLFDAGHELGAALVQHPMIKAVGFTGSRKGGTALMKLAANRPEPIPVYAEMSSINPVLLLPEALRTRGKEIAKDFISSLSLGAGQFCTNPGLILAQSGKYLDAFVEAAIFHLREAPSQTMLTPQIKSAYEQGCTALSSSKGVRELGRGVPSDAPNCCRSALYQTSAQNFLATPNLQSEVFGAASLIVACRDSREMARVVESLEGQLTATLQADQGDSVLALNLIPLLEKKAGRILCNDFPTGVEVCRSMVHGGPFPASSDSRTTSVGSLAIDRFLRPLCYQNIPEHWLPE